MKFKRILCCIVAITMAFATMPLNFASANNGEEIVSPTIKNAENLTDKEWNQVFDDLSFAINCNNWQTLDIFDETTPVPPGTIMWYLAASDALEDYLKGDPTSCIWEISHSDLILEIDKLFLNYDENDIKNWIINYIDSYLQETGRRYDEATDTYYFIIEGGGGPYNCYYESFEKIGDSFYLYGSAEHLLEVDDKCSIEFEIAKTTDGYKIVAFSKNECLHNVVVDKAVEPTCTKTGLTEGKHCSVCDEVLIEQKTVDALGHNFKWIIDKEATTTDKGSKHEECTVCKHIKSSITIPMVQVVDKETGKVEVADEAINEAIEAAKSDNGSIVVEVEKAAPVELSKESVEKVIDAGKALTVKSEEITVTFDQRALERVEEAAEEASDKLTVDVTLLSEKELEDNLNDKQKKAIEKLGDVVVMTAEMFVGDKQITNFKDGTVTIEIPFEAAPGKSLSEYTLVYIDAKGKVHKEKTEIVDGKLVVKLKHFSEYAIVETAEVDKMIAEETENNTPTTNSEKVNTDKVTEKEIVKTGDDTNLAGLMAMLAVSAVLGGTLAVTRKRKEN